jgi:hypothetical protein
MKGERERKKEAREESETVNRDSCVLFSPYRFGRLACYTDDMELRITKTGSYLYRGFGKSVNFFIRTMFVADA